MDKKKQNINITDVTIYYSLHVSNHLDQDIPKTSKKDQQMVITMSKPSTTARRDGKKEQFSQINQGEITNRTRLVAYHKYYTTKLVTSSSMQLFQSNPREHNDSKN